MPKVAANGIDIYYEVSDTGEPLLLISGFGSDLSVWAKVAATLATQNQVIVFDNRGLGRSSAPDNPYTIGQMAEDTAGLLNQIGVRQAHVAGHSMGGMIAQELALAHPEKVRSLMLLSTVAKPDERGKAILESWGELPRLVDQTMVARLILPWLYSQRFYATPGAIQQVMDFSLANPYPPTPHGLYNQSRAVSAFDASARLGAIRCPTLVLVGGEDILAPVSFSEQLAQAIPGAKLIVVPDTGHGLLIESPDAVSRHIVAFLSKHNGK